MKGDRSLAKANEERRALLDRALAARGAPPVTGPIWDTVYWELEAPGDEDAVADRLALFIPWAAGAPSARATVERRSAPAAEPAPDEIAPDSDSWKRHRRRVLGQFDYDGQWCRTRLGLPDLLEPQAVAAWLEKARERENEVGEAAELALPVPTSDGFRAETCTVYRGYVPSLSQTEPDQPLFDLAWRAARIEQATGVPPAGAVLYLLSGVLPYWPPAHAWTERRPFAIVMRVEWPFIDPRIVADLYARARATLFAPRASDDELRAVGAPRLFWAVEALNFVSERRAASVPWKQILDEWNDAYPDHQHRSIGGLRRAYESASERTPDMPPVRAHDAPWRPPAIRPPMDPRAVLEVYRQRRREFEQRRKRESEGSDG